MAILRSPIAHARITRVDVSPALERPGVIAAFSGADLADQLGTLPCAWPVTADMVHPDHHPLAVDEVRHVGEAVAVVVARDRYAAADALEAVEVDYEPLPAVVDMEEALRDERRWSTPTRAPTRRSCGPSTAATTTRPRPGRTSSSSGATSSSG